MSKFGLPCIACGRELENVDHELENQPYAGNVFMTHGNYGSCTFDPMDGHYLELNICDACLLLNRKRVMIGRDSRPIVENDSVVGWEPIKWRLTKWCPSKNVIDHALKMILEADVYHEVYEKREKDDGVS